MGRHFVDLANFEAAAAFVSSSSLVITVTLSIFPVNSTCRVTSSTDVERLVASSVAAAKIVQAKAGEAAAKIVCTKAAAASVRASTASAASTSKDQRLPDKNGFTAKGE